MNELYRRNPNLRLDRLEDTLPEHFFQDYPQLIALFEAFFEFMRSDQSPSAEIRNLFASRDASQVSEDLLRFLQAELLLGVDYFQGFSDQRDAIKLNNLLYSSKGTKFSLEQFFRFFFGVDPEITETKNNVFRVGISEIGAESQQFIKNDRLYQTYAILIKTPLSLSQWEEVYKLFVHPAGVYLGAEVQILDVADLGFTGEEAITDDLVVTLDDVASISSRGQLEITGITP